MELERLVTYLGMNSKYVKRTTKAMCGTSNCADELFIVIQRCKEEDESGRFIRDVRAAPEPAMILVTDAQLLDMVKFCTHEGELLLTQLSIWVILMSLQLLIVISCLRVIEVTNHLCL